MSRRFVCPDPEAVAAYLDRQLAVAERLQFDEHLGGCSRCAALVAESVRTLGDLPERIPVQEPGRNRELRGIPRSNIVWTGAVPGSDRTIDRGFHERPYRGALAVAATIVAMLLAPALPTRLQPRDARLADLAEAVGESRLVEGRLTGGFPHAPLRAPLAGGQGGATVETVRLELAAGRIREEVDRRTTPERLHAFGVSQLLLGRYDHAAMALAAATREQPGNARFLNDAAAVYLERARLGFRPDDLPRALAAAERARVADPSLNEAWFNRALALSTLSLREQAREAWTEYLRRDADSPWADEARQYLATAEAETPAVRWRGVETELRRAVTASVADEAVRLQMSNARQFVEAELLPAWADSAARGVDASGPREALRVLADAFSRVAGDDLYRDAVAAIDRAESRGAAEIQRLAEGHRVYAEAQALFAQDRLSEAGPGLAAARESLARSGSPFEHRAALDLAIVDYVSGRSEDASTRLSELGAAARTARHAYIAARATWIQGLIAFGQLRLVDARARYEETLSAFEVMGDGEQESVANALLAGLHDYLGDDAAAWQHRTAALEGLSLTDSARFRHAILAGMAGAALKLQGPEAALIIQNAVVSASRSIGRAAAVVEALSQRALILKRLGLTEEAKRDRAEARDTLRSIPDTSLRTRVEVLLLDAESLQFASGDAAGAAAAAERAITLVRGRNDRARLAQLNLRLASARLMAGLPGVDEAIKAGLDAFESPGEAPGVASSDEGWQLYALGMRRALDRGDRHRAFVLADGARARALARPVAAGGAVSMREIEGALLADEAVIALNQLDDELVVWLVKRAGTEIVRRPVSRDDGRRLAARFRDEVLLASAAPSAGGALFNEIVRPLAASLKDVRHLVVVPDAPYASVPFAALWDQGSRRFLVESRSISYVASVAAVANAARRHTSAAGYIHLDRSATAEAAMRLWSEVPDGAVVHLSAPARANQERPHFSRVDFADLPGRPYSGMILTSELSSWNLSRADTLFLSNVHGDNGLVLANSFLAAGVESVVSATGGFDDSQTMQQFESLRAVMGPASSVADGVSAFQRDVLRQTGHRLGAWSSLMVFGAGR